MKAVLRVLAVEVPFHEGAHPLDGGARCACFEVERGVRPWVQQRDLAQVSVDNGHGTMVRIHIHAFQVILPDRLTLIVFTSGGTIATAQMSGERGSWKPGGATAQLAAGDDRHAASRQRHRPSASFVTALSSHMGARGTTNPRTIGRLGSEDDVDQQTIRTSVLARCAPKPDRQKAAIKVRRQQMSSGGF